MTSALDVERTIEIGFSVRVSHAQEITSLSIDVGDGTQLEFIAKPGQLVTYLYREDDYVRERTSQYFKKPAYTILDERTYIAKPKSMK